MTGPQDIGQQLAVQQAQKAAWTAGPMCRCVPCCCDPGQGHNHPAWIAYEAEARAEEGWPPVCTDGQHVTPHRGCILR